MAKIERITARQILDSRDTPTVEAEVFLDDGSIGKASVPSGASTGEYEAFELRDNDPTVYNGKSVLKAIANIEEKISPALAGTDIINQHLIDKTMIELDGTENKKNLGANAILAVSMASARAAAASEKLELYQYLSRFLQGPPLRGRPSLPHVMPRAMFNFINGGKHAQRSSDFQEYMVIPLQEESFAKRLQCASEIYQALKKILNDNGLPTTLGDEGGFAPPVSNNREPLSYIMQAIEAAGYKPGTQVGIGIDLASSEFYQNGSYHLDTENKILSPLQMIDYCSQLVYDFPIISLEDPLEQNDFEGFAEITEQLGSHVQIVGDDLYTTNTQRLQQGINKKSSTAVLIKVNQIGTITETINAIKLAYSAGMKCIVSHRSGETEDAFIADFAVAMGANQVKMGSVSRSERVAKYNRLLEIENIINSLNR